MSEITNYPQKGLVLTWGVHEICLGAKCIIRHPHSLQVKLPSTYHCDGHEAEVVGFNPVGEKNLCSVNLQMKTGPCEGQIVTNVDTKYLEFIELQKSPNVRLNA